jgi:branched-chain amino acid transport system ATP-binding protein
MDGALAVENVVKRFRGLHALDGVSLSVREGEIVGLIGPNGSGKTTLLNVASGVLDPTSGRVTVGGVDATGRKPHEVARLGVGRTFQQIRLFAEMTVEENVEVGAVARGAEREEVGALLERLKLTADRDRLATTLPYGQQRRVEIVRALAGRPRFLLLDEPAAGMNEVESDGLLETIRLVRDDEGCAVLVVDHDLRLIMRLCERIHVLAEGNTICEGTAQEVRRDPAVIQAYLGTAAEPSTTSHITEAPKEESQITEEPKEEEA